MTARIRPNRLGYIALTLLSIAGSLFLLSNHYLVLSPHNLARWDGILSPDIRYSPYRNQTVFLDNKAESRLNRISLGQSYENARVALLPKDSIEGEFIGEEEGHEDYIFRLSRFVQDYFVGSKAQEYLVTMLENLNDHISPPLLKSGIRMVLMNIVGDARRSKRRRAVVAKGASWDLHVFDRQMSEMAMSALCKGSAKLTEMQKNLHLQKDRQILLRYLTLLKWGGGFTDKLDSMQTFSLHEAIQGSEPVLSQSIATVRSLLQPLSTVPSALPRFMPPSHNPNWTRRIQSELEREVGLVLYRRRVTPRVDHLSLSSETIIAKAFHPVFLDVLERINRHILQHVDDQDMTAGIPLDGARFLCVSTIHTNGEQKLMFSHEAVDRYLQVQYGVSLKKLADRDEDLWIGDVLLLRHRDQKEVSR